MLRKVDAVAADAGAEMDQSLYAEDQLKADSSHHLAGDGVMGAGQVGTFDTITLHAQQVQSHIF